MRDSWDLRTPPASYRGYDLRVPAQIGSPTSPKLLVSIGPDADVLIDPDTGIREREPQRAHVSIAELQLMMEGAPERLLIAYDEGCDRRVPKVRHVELLGASLTRCVGPSIAYEAGRSVTIFIVGQSVRRVARAHQALGAFLGLAKERRLHYFSDVSEPSG